jgi:hypothetical protein
MKQQLYDVVLSSNLDQKSTALLDVKHLSPADRFQRAAKRSGLLFLAAVFSVFIPAAHFILVPTFLGLSIYSIFSMMRKHFSIIEGEITCPQCAKKITPTAASFNWPLHLTCEGCQMQIRVTSRQPDLSS